MFKVRHGTFKAPGYVTVVHAKDCAGNPIRRAFRAGTHEQNPEMLITSGGARVTGGEVEIVWSTRCETEIAAFDVLRASSVEGPYTSVLTSPIPAHHGGYCEGSDYVYREGATQEGRRFFYQLWVLLYSGERTFGSTFAVDIGLTQDFALRQCSPNPFHGMTEVRFNLPYDGRSRFGNLPEYRTVLSVFDASGRRVKVLFDGEKRAGRYSLDWDGTDSSGGRVPAGVYVCLLEIPGKQLSRKVVLVR
ncbi:MAG: FlgD immunoglobulin-like domain containing protein [Candidatus Eisenbacteria bacterium]|nr:FlgD immunoglobulin-like domain containing protein [Candidatus Eisenbacteria bacterium]